MLMEIIVAPGRNAAQPAAHGDGQISRWPTATRAALGSVTGVLGDIDRRASIPDHHPQIRHPDEHSAESVAEAVRLGGAVSEKDIRGRTIPPDADRHDRRRACTATSDDAITIEKLPNGHYWWVCILPISRTMSRKAARSIARHTIADSVYFRSAPFTCFRRSWPQVSAV